MMTETTDNRYEYYASCPQGFESLLASELKRLRAKSVRPLKGGVVFFGTKEDGYRVCLWSRLASRVTRVLARVDASNADELYAGVKTIKWESYVPKDGTISVTARGTNTELRNTQFTAVKVKDAICDRLRVMTGSRPNVASERPNVPVWVSIHKNKATISLDYAGESLHRRGYRQESVEAPLKEALAAGMLVWSGWDRAASPALRYSEAKRKGKEGFVPAPVFIDPVCGSGTLVLEAAMMAANRAPGLSRDYWGFEGCADFDEDCFSDLLADADEKFEAGLETMPVMIGSDIDERAIQISRASARRLGFADKVIFEQSDCEQLTQVLERHNISLQEKGFIALNPPYGIRLLPGELEMFYRKLSSVLRLFSNSWQMVAITPDVYFDSSIGFCAEEELPVFNGNIAATLRAYRMGTPIVKPEPLVTLTGKEVSVEVSSDHALQFAARLRKMAKVRRKWARKNDIHAYRIYDADLPDYAVAVDLFEHDGSEEISLLVSEYQAPKEIDSFKAAQRFKDACAVVAAYFEVDSKHLFTRVRRQAKGGSQYRSDKHISHSIMVRENGFPFELDLSGYLDTGLFLDHRITRQLVGKKAENTRFLNLFAYTGTATVYAAFGGARTTTTVDMSQTYLDWAKRNMQHAGFTGAEHCFVRADVLSWVELAVQNGEQYDLIFVDPPTFSNSKTMGNRTWDIQRDHVSLLSKLNALLAPEGIIVFSGNLRSFKLDEESITANGLNVQNITTQTIPEDFSRNPKIHFCYVLTKQVAQ